MVLRSLWVVPVADLGGVSRHVIDAVRTGVPGWQLTVLCPEGPLASKLHDLGAQVITGPVSPADGTAAAVRTIRRVLTRLRPDVLHTHLAFADLAGVAAVAGRRSGRGKRIRVVSTEHGISGVRGLYQSGALQASVKSSAHALRLRRTDAVIAVSDSTREQILEQWGSAARIIVIRNAVEAPEPVPEPVPGLRVLSLARLAPEKRIDQLLRAMAVVVREHPEARLTVAGSGPLEADLRDLALDLGLGDHVSFPGHVDAGVALAEHDVVVQLSTWENLSYTLLDAVAYGLGVVATDVGGNREIVPERCLVEAGDHGVVARVIVRQGSTIDPRPAGWDAEMAASMGRPAAASALDGMCSGIGEVYEEVLG